MNALVVSSNSLAMLFEYRELALECRKIAQHITGIGILGHQFERDLLAVSGDQQGNMGLLHPFGLVDRAANLVIVSLKGGLLLVSQSQNDLDGFAELPQALWRIGILVAIGVILLLVPACSDAKGVAPMREHIEGRSHFRL